MYYVHGYRSLGCIARIVTITSVLSFACTIRSDAGPLGEKGAGRTVLYNSTDTLALWEDITGAKNWKTPEQQAVFYREKLQECKDAQWIHGVIHCAYQLGLAYKNSGDYDKGLAVFREALGLSYINSGYRGMLPKIYNGIGSIFLVQGQMESSVRCFHQGISLLHYDTTGVAAGSLYNNLAGVLTRMKRYEEALNYLEKAATLAEQQQNDRLLCNVLSNKGSVFFLQQDYSRALFYFENLLKLSREKEIVQMEHSSLYNIGMIYMAREMPDKALYYFQKMQRIDGYINPYNATAGDLAIGKAYFSLRQMDHAERLLKEVAAKAARFELNNELIKAHDVLSRLYQEKGDFRKAFLHKDTFHFLNEKFESRQVLNNINHLEAKFRTAQKDKEIAQQHLQLNRQERDLERNKTWLYLALAGTVLLIVILMGIARMYRQRQKLHANHIQMLQRDQEIFRQEREIAELKAIMQGEEKERARIARELHDGIVSTLSATRLHFSTLVSRIKNSSYEEEFREILDQIADATQELRVTAQNLTPEILMQNGLLDAVDQFCRKISKVSGLEIDFEAIGTLPPLQEDFELSLYRMIQELIHNVVKHARASGMIIQISSRNDRLYVSVEDNGVGIYAHQDGKHSTGTGLKNIDARMKVMNGKMHIDSDQNGTAVYLEFDIYYVKK